MPSLVKLVHSLDGHFHEVCTDNFTEHFHEQELNCEFQLFHLNTQLAVEPMELGFSIEESFQSDFCFREKSFHKTSQWQLLLRGPPNRLRNVI